MPEAIKTGRLFRSISVERSAVDAEARTVELAFSSEVPVERYFGVEILDHSPQSVRFNRLAGSGPLLVDHNSRDQVGIVESVNIGTDRVGRAVVRFGKSERAEEIFQDVIDGIRKNVSVGYEIYAMVMTEAGKDGANHTYRITDWEPLEISIVSIPADVSVGVGREQPEGNVTQVTRSEELESPTPAEPPAVTESSETVPEIVIMPEEAARLKAEAESRGRAETVKGVGEIIAIGEQFAARGGEKIAADFIRSGKTDVSEFRAQLMNHISTDHTDARAAEIGLSAREAKDFSMVRAINALVTGDWSKAGFEREASMAVSKVLGRDARGFFVPIEVQRRDLTVGTATAGGHLVSTDLRPQDFISMLRNKMVVMGLGARMLTGLVGNVAIPRQTGGATTYWVTEGNAPTESGAAFDQVTMAPKTLGAFSDISRKLLLQSSNDIEQLVRGDLATQLAIELDRAAINGSASGAEPRGILQVSGIGDVAGGTDGAAPTWAHILGLETEVAIDNADVGGLAYLINAKTRGKLKSTSKVSGQNGFVYGEGESPLNGYRCGVTNQVPSTLTKGAASAVCSAILFGNFNDLIIGQWGALDILVDPYTGSTTGTVRVVALQDADVAVRHAQSFAAMKDALTT